MLAFDPTRLPGETLELNVSANVTIDVQFGLLQHAPRLQRKLGASQLRVKLGVVPNLVFFDVYERFFDTLYGDNRNRRMRGVGFAAVLP